MCNMKINKKNIVAVVILLSLTIIFCILSKYKKIDRRLDDLTDENLFVITSLDVGDADAAVLYYKNCYGLIDTATSKKYEVISDYLDSQGVTELSFMMLSHFDQDHIGNATKILEKYKVNTVFIPDYESKKEYYPKLMEILENQDDVRIVSAKVSYLWKDIHFDILPAIDKDRFILGDSPDNNMSLVTVIKYGDNRVLFTGDIETDRINELLDSGEDIKCDWIKMPHHGRYQSEIDLLIKSVDPEYAVVSCGNKKGVPKQTKKLLDNNEVKLFDTGKSNIITVCDGITINVYDEIE